MLPSCLYLNSLTLAVIFISLQAERESLIDIRVGPGESWIHWIMGCGAAGTNAGGRKSESLSPWCFQSCSMDAFCGPLILYPKLLSRHFSLARLKVYHATFGLACYVLASTTLVLGLNSDWARVQFPAFIRYCFITCPIICALVVTNQVTNGYLMRKRMQM
uniref:ascorbate ferrireductase (transmembrane) n=1 Tax=Eptatretus burgeri TaxID=7764 RepID=A0A8C4R4Q9_EPTBU